MRRPLALLACVAVVAAAGAVLPTTAARAATPRTAPASLPSADPFYTYTGTTALADVPPGTVLDTRAVTLAAGTSGTPLPAEQLLYRTQDELGRPSVTVTTVVVPTAATLPGVTPDIVAYLSFYDALSDKCDPSYTLQGGDPGSANTELTDLEQGLVQTYAAADPDAVVTVPDFEGEGLDWTAGHEAGYDTLDAITATENYLNQTRTTKLDPTTTKVGLTGYSGGSIAADWASELAPTYAPSLDIVGVAEGGIPVDFAHNLTYINGSQDWSGIIPAVLQTLSHVYGIDLSTYLSPLGMTLTQRDSDECIGEFEGTTPGLTVAQLLKPQYADFLAIPAFATVVNKLLMGTVPGDPKGPLFLAVGNDPSNAQGQGDDIMVTADVQALAHEYCTEGVPVNFTVYSHSDHDEAALQFEPAAVAFLDARFAGTPFVPESCTAIGTGNALTPLPTTATPTSSTTASTSATPTASTSPTTSPAAAEPAQAGAELAYTGADPAGAVVGLALLAAGAAALALRRRR